MALREADDAVNDLEGLAIMLYVNMKLKDWSGELAVSPVPSG